MEIQKNIDLAIFLKFIVNNILKLILLLLLGLVIGYFSHSYFFKTNLVNINTKIESQRVHSMEMQALNFIIREIHNFQYLDSFDPIEKKNYDELMVFNKVSYNEMSYLALQEFIKSNHKDFNLSKRGNDNSENSNVYKFSYKADSNSSYNDIEKQLLEFESSLNNYFYSRISNQMKNLASSFERIKIYKAKKLAKEIEIYDNNYEVRLNQLVKRLEEEKKVAIDLDISDGLKNLTDYESIQLEIQLPNENDIDYSFAYKNLFLYGSNVLDKIIDTINSRMSRDVSSPESAEVTIKLQKVESLFYNKILFEIFDNYLSDGYFSENYKLINFVIDRSDSYLLYLAFFSLLPILIYFFYSYLIFVYNNANKQTL